MNYTKYLEDLNDASLFDLFRIKCAINQMIEDPDKLIGVKRNLSSGMEISYFDQELNKLIDAVVINAKRSRVLVQNKLSGERWNIPFHMINLEGVDTSVRSRNPSKQLDRTSLSIGDHVGFHSKLGIDLYGAIIKLNPKCAKLKLTNGETWRVAYSLLFSVMDGHSQENNNEGLLIEGSFNIVSNEIS